MKLRVHHRLDQLPIPMQEPVRIDIPKSFQNQELKFHFIIRENSEPMNQ